LAERTFLQLNAENRIWFGKTGKSRPRLKKFLSESEGVTSWTWWPHVEVGHNQEATRELNEIMGRADVFDNPKPTRLIRRILQIASESDSLLLDSFSGSGTTGHAVLAQNKADGGHRRFILVEMDEKVCRDVTAVRLKRVAEGYENTPGLGGGFRYCRLGEPLFDEAGNIRETVKFPALAAHIFFTETGAPIPKPATGRTPLLGAHRSKAVYLLFNGVMGDKRPEGGNVLTAEILRGLPREKAEVRVIYGEGCRLGAARLKREGIVFKQIPYQIKVT
jgi:site-specific DNA-methyltransferase (adenine-specific)/adenine-specific DNA-methyltransferase